MDPDSNASDEGTDPATKLLNVVAVNTNDPACVTYICLGSTNERENGSSAEEVEWKAIEHAVCPILDGAKLSSVGNLTGLDKKPSDCHTLNSTEYPYHCATDASMPKESVCCRHFVAHNNCLLKNGGYCVSVDTTELPDESCHHCKVPTVVVFGFDVVEVKVTVD